MNKKFFIVAILIFCLGGYLSSQSKTSVWSGQISKIVKGNGTTSDPYLIETAEQLAYLSTEEAKANGFLSAHFQLVTDIDLNHLLWTPIGAPAFTGVFDGNGHTVKNVNINTSGHYGPISWDANLGYDYASWTTNWTDASQLTYGKTLYDFRDGNIRIWTESGTRQRPKIRAVTQDHTTGEYNWRVYIPPMEMNSQVSIGAFLYYDDEHELDFEIGSGTAAARSAVNAQDDEVLMYITSQLNPEYLSIQPIQSGKWHDLRLSISETNDHKYFVKWIVNGAKVGSVKLEYGKEIPFGILCSLENLEFMGDAPSTREHYVLFNKMGFTPK
ncbi:MAG TPA: hypothetical protein PLO29_01490 [Paludibacter sp.]|nr:MAG: hypothetical protein BWY08_00171 [Bacteroidetes bacterium ADurb.Bin174]HQB27599.1 hypothetical protein [Paludibacter sp.]